MNLLTHLKETTSLFLAALGLACFGLSPTARAAESTNTPLVSPQPTFTTFDVPGAVNGTFPIAINPAGVIAGASVDASFVSHGFVRAKDGTITTFDVPGAVNGTETGSSLGGPPIDPAGVITGTYFDMNFVGHGFVRAKDGTITTFDVPGAVNGTSPQAINPSGVIMGTYFDANFVGHGFLRAHDGTITTFDAPGAGTGFFQGTFAFSINPAGTIAGSYTDQSNVGHGFLRASDGSITTVDVPGSASTEPVAINPAGAITGSFSDASGAFHGFLRTQ